MNEEEMQTRHVAELAFLESVVKEMGYPTRLLEQSEELPYPSLLVGLEPDAGGRPLEMACTFYPLSDELENTLLLQYFVEFAAGLDDAGLARIRELLPELNNRVVVGHFGLTVGTNKMHYRYTQALRLDDVIGEESVGDVLMLVTSTPVLFGDLLARVAGGGISIAAARQEIEDTFTKE
jgi:hypothetical protein